MRQLVLASLAVVFAADCVQNDGSVFIEGAIPFDPETECDVDAGGDVFATSGTLDLSAPRSFQAALRVSTNLPATFNNQDVSQDQTRSPNFPDYGATDNNVIIFDEAETIFTLTVPADADIIATVEEESGGALQCDNDGVCATSAAKPLVSAVGSSVFNPQTSLNSKAAVVVELINAGFADVLAQSLEDVLELPGNKVRVVATVLLKGTTTGNGDLREIKTFPFPFPVDVCIGCLVPDNALCQAKGADAAVVLVDDGGDPIQTCFRGQDFPQAACVCDDGSLLDATPCPG